MGNDNIQPAIYLSHADGPDGLGWARMGYGKIV